MQSFTRNGVFLWVACLYCTASIPMASGALPPRPEAPGPSSRATGLVISEIMFHPADRIDGRKQEFIEIYNSSPFPEDVSGYRLSGDVSFTFPPDRIIASGQYLVVADKFVDFTAIYPNITNVIGNFSGALSLNSGTIRLRNRSDAILLEVDYKTESPWPILPDGKGYSLVLSRPSYGQSNPRAWSASAAPGGSPGQAEPAASSPLANIVINEYLANSALPDLDFIELYNRGSQDVDLSGCSLSDSPDTNKFTFQGATIAAGSYLALDEFSLGFSLKADGDTIYFRNPAGAILDIARYGPQSRGISQGRVPEGGGEFYPLVPSTPFAQNTTQYSSDVVINEIMYAPISGDSSDEYVELYNRTTNAINVSGWQFADGITFTIPAQTTIPGNGYLVVARDASRLLANYPTLSATNTVGNFTGSLADGGERLALTRPEAFVQNKITNFLYVVADEVSYHNFGLQSGQWSRGGGSSLELIDARSENRLAPNWADSSEGGPGTSNWTTIEVTGALDNGVPPAANSELFVLMLGAGECLLDDVEVLAAGNPNSLVSNGRFDSSAAGWVTQGNHERSTWTADGSAPGSGSLRLRASGPGHPVGNCVKTALPLPLTSGTVTLRAKAKWLRGNPNIVLRLSGNYLEAAATLSVPAKLGTPGERNSRAIANSGPAIFNVQHAPAIPAAGQSVLVTAQFHDPDGLAQSLLRYRVDPASSFTTVAMNDNGTGGDVAGSDGIFSATIPGQGANTLVAFYIEAADGLANPATNRFPSVPATGAPERECYVRFGETASAGAIGTYRIWMSSNSVNRWTSRDRMSDEPLDCTVVYGTNRVIYNAGIRYGGDTLSRSNFTSPVAPSSAYLVTLPADDMLHGSEELLLEPGSSSKDPTALREISTTWMAEQLGIPFHHLRFVHIAINGVHNTSRGVAVFLDRQLPDSAYLESWFSDDVAGELFEATSWIEPAGAGIRVIEPARLLAYTTTGGIKKKARYRSNWPKKDGLGSAGVGFADDYGSLYQLVDILTATGPTYMGNLQAHVDLEEWISALAFRHVVGDWDAYGYLGGRNDFIYKGSFQTGASQKWKMLSGRSVYPLGAAGGHPPTADPFLLESGETSLARIYDDPALRRIYLRTLQRAVTSLLLPVQSRFIDPAYLGFQSNGVSTLSPLSSGIYDWLNQRRNYLATLIPTNAFALSQTNVIDTANNLISLTGTAPLAVQTITVNGVAYPITWTTPTNWLVRLAVNVPRITLTVEAWDSNGAWLGGGGSIVVNYSGAIERPEDSLVINEIMYHPAVSNATYVEIFNRSAGFAFDISNWQLTGVEYIFPRGSIITNGEFLVIAKSRDVFAQAYGFGIPVFGEFPGTLDLSGEILELLATNISLAVRYEPVAPWPAAADGSGLSLQLIDASRDISRVANWSANDPTPGTPNLGVVANIPDFPKISINELQPNNFGGVSDSTSTREPWIELVITLNGPLSLDGFSLSTSFANLDQWFFPSGTVLRPENFPGPFAYVAIFADGQPEQTGTFGQFGFEFHTNFRLSPTNGTIVLAKDQRILDYLNYRDMDGSFSYGSFPENQLVKRQAFFYPTPGSANDPRPKVIINEWLASNVGGLLDPANNSRNEDWLELYNAASQEADLSGFHLTDNLGQPFKWTFPAGTRIGPRGFLLVWADNAAGPSTPTNLHADFQLSRGGESIGLYAPDGRWVDSLSFGQQQNNISQGLYPDGNRSGVTYLMTTTTPGATNFIPTNRFAPVFRSLTNFSVFEGAYFFLSILATDADVPVQTLTYSLDPGAPDGAGLYGGGFSWTPTEQQGGATYSITVRVSDNGMPPLTDSRTFSVTVIKSNALPVIETPDPYAVVENASVTFTIHAWDNDWPAQTLTFSLDPGAPAGASIDPLSGQFTWTPSESQGPSTNTIWVRATDNGTPAGSMTVPVLIYVTEVNAPPTLANPGTVSINELADSAISLMAGDPDLPPNNLQFQLLSPLLNGMTFSPQTGRLNWTPSEARGPGSYSVTVRVFDDGTPSLSATQTFNIVVGEVNSAPVLTNLNGKIYRIGKLTSITLTNAAIDSDVPANAIAYELLSGPAGALFDPLDGVFSWTPSEQQWPSTNRITVRAYDNGTPSLSATQTFTVMVFEKFNRPPELQSLPVQTAFENTMFTFRIDAYDPDNAGLIFSLGQSPPGAIIEVDSQTGVFIWTPGEGDGGSTNIVEVIVTDDDAPPLSATQLVTIVVMEVNTAPVLTNPGQITINELQGYTNSLIATDADIPSDPIIFNLVAPFIEGVTLNTLSGRLSWTPTEAQGPGNYSINVRVYNPGLSSMSTTQTLSITVAEVNSPPILTNLNNIIRMVAELSTITLTNKAIDSDIPANSLTYQILSAPPGASCDGASGIFTWTPTIAQSPSTNLVSIRVSDNGLPSLSATQSLTIIVRPAPRITAIQQINAEDVSLSWQCQLGRRYQLEYKDDLGAPPWQVLTNSQLTAQGSSETLIIKTVGRPQRFYRVVLLD